MCIPVPKVTGNTVTMTCMDSGKPIIQSDRYGMHCADMCGAQDEKAQLASIQAMLANTAKQFGRSSK